MIATLTLASGTLGLAAASQAARVVDVEITVLDHSGLEAASCPCYQAFNDMYKLHLGVENAPKSKRANGQQPVAHLMIK